MAKRMLFQITEEEHAKLKSLTTAAAITAYVDTLNLGMADATQLASKYKGELMTAGRPAQNDLPEAVATAFGVGGVGAAMAATRVAELLKGKQMHYEAQLFPTELAGRLQTLLADKFRINRMGDSVVVNALSNGKRLCEVRFSLVAEVTNVTVSRPDLDEAKDTTADVVDEAVRRATRPGGFGGFGGLLDLGRKVVTTVVDTASELAEVNVVIEAIEAYGAEGEAKAATARRLAVQKAADDKQIEYLKTHCPNCSTVFEAGATNCPNCGAPVA